MRAAAILFASGFVLFAMAGVAPALPAIERAFADLPDAALLTRMVLTVTALFIALSAPLAGFALDRFGRRPVLLAALLVYLGSATAPIWLDDLHAILVSRAILGAAVGTLLTGLTTLIGDFYEGSARNRMAGAQFAVMVLGMAVGTTVAGFLADAGWRLPFYMYFAVALAIPLIAIVTRKGETAAPRAASPRLLAPGARFAVLPIALIYLVVWATMASTFVVPSQAPFLLREIGVPHAAVAGVAIALFNVAAGMGAFAFRHLRERFANPAILAGALLLLGAGYLIAASADGAGGVLAGLVVAGAGFGPVMPTLSAWLLGIAPTELRGRLVGGLTFFQFMGFFCSPFYSQPVAESWNMTGSFVLTGGVQLAGGAAFAIAALALRRRGGAG